MCRYGDIEIDIKYGFNQTIQQVDINLLWY